MFRLDYSNTFKRKYKKLKITNPVLHIKLADALSILKEKGTLPNEYNEHKLKANWEGYWSFHLKGNYIVLYQKNNVVYLKDIGTHKEVLGIE